LATSPAFFSFCKPCCGAGTIIGGVAARFEDERMVKLGAPADELCKRKEEDHQRPKALAAIVIAKGQHRIFLRFIYSSTAYGNGDNNLI
jgi:hypothetical protein